MAVIMCSSLKKKQDVNMPRAKASGNFTGKKKKYKLLIIEQEVIQ